MGSVGLSDVGPGPILPFIARGNKSHFGRFTGENAWDSDPFCRLTVGSGPISPVFVQFL